MLIGFWLNKGFFFNIMHLASDLRSLLRRNMYDLATHRHRISDALKCHLNSESKLYHRMSDAVIQHQIPDSPQWYRKSDAADNRMA